MVAATYGFVSAFGQNIALIPTLTTGMKWFPNRKGIIKTHNVMYDILELYFLCHFVGSMGLLNYIFFNRNRDGSSCWRVWRWRYGI